MAALLAPSPTGNIDVADPSHFPDRLLAPIEADRPGAAHKDVEQAADHRQILEEMKVLVLILIGRHRPELVSDERGADGEGGEQQGREAGLEAQHDRGAGEELHGRAHPRPYDVWPPHPLPGQGLSKAVEARAADPR